MGWQRAKQILISCLAASASIQPQQKLLCHFVLGKVLEKQNFSVQLNQALKHYLLAEQQLCDQTDDGSFLIKLEINFRITASIYKYVTQPVVNMVIEKSVLSSLLAVLKRNKDQIFTNTELDMRTNSAENIDENDNRIGDQQENVVSTAVSMVFFAWRASPNLKFLCCPFSWTCSGPLMHRGGRRRSA